MGRQAVVVSLRGDLDLEVRDELQWALAGLIEAPIAVVDLSAVTFADSTLINAIRETTRMRAARLGIATRLRLVGASPIVERMFTMTRLASIVDFFGSIQEAEIEWSPANFPHISLADIANESVNG